MESQRRLGDANHPRAQVSRTIGRIPTQRHLTRALDGLQDSANEASGGGSPSRSRRVSQLDGSTEPFTAQGAAANPADRPPLDRFSSASTSLNLARRLVLSLLAPDAQEEAPGGAATAVGAVHSCSGHSRHCFYLYGALSYGYAHE